MLKYINMRNFGITRSRLRGKRKLFCDLSELILCVQNSSKLSYRSNTEEQEFQTVIQRKQILGFLLRNFTVLAYHLFDKDFIWVYIPRNKQSIAQKFIKNFAYDIRVYHANVTERSREMVLIEPVICVCIDEVICNITDFTLFRIMFHKM